MGLTRVIYRANYPLKRSQKFANTYQISNSKFSYTVRYVWRIPVVAYFLAIINKRDPNQGTCTNACRWEYKMEEGTTDEVGNIVPKIDPAQQIEVKKCRANFRRGCSNG